MKRTSRRVALVQAQLLAGLPLCAWAGEERHGPIGVALDVPLRYEAVPVRPTEPWIVLRYAGETRSKEAFQVNPSLYLLRIDWRPDPDPCPPPQPITTFERYVEQEQPQWRLGEVKPAKARAGWTCTEVQVRGLKEGGPFGSAFLLRNSECTWVLLGTCDPDELEKEARLWRRCAESLEFFEPVAPKDAVRWKRHYEKNPVYRNPELRLRLRSLLVDGWEADDTENFLILSSTKKETLVNLLARRLEGIRRAYVERFPPAAEITAVSTVRICEDQAEYHRYGGPAGTAGYWSPPNEELVLFVFEMEGGNWKEGKENSLSVLYHEAFHQYVHYAAGELAPHSWFGEGYGDYFGGANFTPQGTLGRIEVHPWRIFTIQEAIRRGQHPSWREIAWMSQQDFYAKDRGIHYAMGWSMVFFLNECKKVRKEPAWARILPVYFDTLKAAHAREQGRLQAAGLLEKEEEVEQARKAARDEASTAAFHDVDLYEIEAAWREFTLELKPPK